MVLTLENVMEALSAALSPDLLSAKWNRLSGLSPNPLDGHCAIAAEALYDLLGDGLSGYVPYVCSYYEDAAGEMHFSPAPKGHEVMTHWWLRGWDERRGRGKGAVLDPTAGQYDAPFPYEMGRAIGFMSPHPPSKRARILIARIEKALGAEKIADFREAQIRSFQNGLPANQAQPVSIAARRRRAELLPFIKAYGIRPACRRR